MIFLVAFLSLIMGNLMTTFFYRLPRNIAIHREKAPPMCSFCGTRLKFFQYAPLFYRVFYGKKSLCCNKDIPQVYTAIELVIMCLNLTSYLYLGLENYGLCVFLITPVLVCICFIFYYHQIIPKDLLWLQAIGVILCKIYGLKVDLADIVVLAMFLFITLLAIEKLCKRHIDANVKIFFVLLGTMLPTTLFSFIYNILLFITWFLIAKEIVSIKKSFSALAISGYILMLY